MLKEKSVLVSTLSLTMILVFLITGCFETGENQGCNKILLNGSVLKGVVTQADVMIFNRQSKLIWQGTTDNNGKFTAEFVQNSSSAFTVVARVAKGAMQCDATECISPVSSLRYEFGVFIPGNELGNVDFKSAIYLNNEDNSCYEGEVTSQMNGLSTLLVNMVKKPFEQDLSKEQFELISLSSSAIITAALGLVVNEGFNILDVVLPNINHNNSLNQNRSVNQNDSISKVKEQTAIMGLINASLANDIAKLAEFSDTLLQLIASPEDGSARNKLIKIQQLYLQEANKLIDSDYLQIDNVKVRNSINQALADGVNWDELLAAIEAFLINSGKLPSEISASSTYWGAGINRTEEQWWWVSASDSDSDEWVALEYSELFVAVQVDIGFSNQYQGKNVVIGVSANGANSTDWVKLADVNALDNQQEYIDNRNVRHISFTLNNIEAYKQYRFHSEQTNSVWLEYFCVYQLNSASESITNQVCENSKTPSKTFTSSLMFAPKNINNSEPKSWWLSELGSGNEEWLQISYQLGFVAKRVEIVVKQSNQGEKPSLQGSNDGIDWVDIVTNLSTNEFPNEWIDEQGFRHFEVMLNNKKGYRFYRYYSAATSLVWLKYLHFSD